MLIRILLIALVLLVVYKLFTTDFKKKREADEKEQNAALDKKAAAGELLKDPVCGAYVAVEDSIRVRDGDKIYHFCSYDCRDKFLKLAEQEGTAGRELPAKAGQEASDSDSGAAKKP